MKNVYLLIILILIQLITICYAIHVNMNYIRLKRSYKAFMKGKDGRTLEKSILDNAQKIEALELITEEHNEQLRKLSTKSKGTFQKTGIVKYDAFGEEEGALSFALTVLDENNNGWVMNFVQGSFRNYNYIKEVVSGESYIELSNEEKESLEKAMDQEYYDLKEEPDDLKDKENMENTDDIEKSDVQDILDELEKSESLNNTEELENLDDTDIIKDLDEIDIADIADIIKNDTNDEEEI